MDSRLENADKILANLTTEDEAELERELAFAIACVDINDAATLDWLAAVAVARAEEVRTG